MNIIDLTKTLLAHPNWDSTVSINFGCDRIEITKLVVEHKYLVNFSDVWTHELKKVNTNFQDTPPWEEWFTDEAFANKHFNGMYVFNKQPETRLVLV